jgi:hypothetical protein
MTATVGAAIAETGSSTQMEGFPHLAVLDDILRLSVRDVLGHCYAVIERAGEMVQKAKAKAGRSVTIK